MRSKKTTNILLLLAFLFILTIIILCLLPTKSGPADTPLRGGLEGDEPRKTTSKAPTKTTIRSPVTTKVTTSTPMELSTTSTVKEEYEKTSSTERTTTKKSLPLTTVKEETSSTQPPVTSSPISSTTLKLTTLPKYAASTTTQHSTLKETEPRNETYTLFESSTETSLVNETGNITSAPSTTPPTTLGTTITTLVTSTNPTTTTTNTTTSPPTTYTTTTTTTTPPTTTTTTTPPTTTPPTTTPPTTTPPTTITTPPTTTTTTPPTTTTTTTPPTTTTTTTTTTAIPTTIPYDHTFTLYTEPEGVCTSDGCKDMSGKMLDSIYHETDPCEDFHEYSCGGVHKDELLRPENAEETLDEILKEQLVSHETNASKFYDSCLSYLDGTENLKHEENFPPNLKINLPESEFTEWPSENLTNTISYLINRDLPVLFDITAEVRKIDASIKILPKLRISLFDDYKDHYDHKYCIDQYSRRMLEKNNKGKEEKGIGVLGNYKKLKKPDDGKGKPENHTDLKIGKLMMNTTTEEEEIIDVDINAEYQQYLECMNTTGLDLRINRLESVLKESDLFAPSLKMLDKQSQINKVRAFLTDINGILFPLTDTEETETSSDIITLGELLGNTALGGLIKWDSLLESLHGSKLDESQQIIVKDVQKFSRLFTYFKETWSDRNLENVLLMLAGEKLFKKGEDREHKKNFCFKITKKYLPLDMQLLFTKSYSKEDLNVLISEISNLGSSLAKEIAKITRSYYNVPTHVEFIDLQTLKSNMDLLKPQQELSGHFLDDLSILQTRYRKDMYNMTGQELEEPESCRLLPREIQFDCNLHMEEIIVPLEQLVAPNFYFRKDMPNYLRLQGVTYYYLRKMMALLGPDALNLKDYKGNICLIQNIPTHFEDRNSKLRIKYKTHFTEEMKSETLMEFQIFNLAWQSIKTLMSKKSGGLKVNETKELPLIWLGAESLHPLKAFLIRKAQESCNENKDFDLLRISRFKSPPKSFWINSLVKIDSLFGGAWHCASNTSMAETRVCPPEPTTKDWFDPHTTPALTPQ